MSLQETPTANRLHIAIFGRRNTGKSSLINAITNQPIALVSDIAGTTTDPVYKNMEVNGLGACTLIDTAGFDDSGELGLLRIGKTKEALQKTDIAIVLFDDAALQAQDFTYEKEWVAQIKNHQVPIVAVVNKSDQMTDEQIEALRQIIKKEFDLDALSVSAQTSQGIDALIAALIRSCPEDFEAKSITAHLISAGDMVLLVMPQDIQAPRGRLILPQVQTIRDLLDNKCLVLSVTTDRLQQALDSLKEPPKLIITDSQVFAKVYAMKPLQSMLTSFSALFAGHKGDIKEFVQGAQAIDTLRDGTRILIAEACTHKPLDGDIGRQQIPALLRKYTGAELAIDVVPGNAFPADLSPYALVIHCGACMFNRKYMTNRIAAAKAQAVPITNYGIALAKMNGILEHITY